MANDLLSSSGVGESIQDKELSKEDMVNILSEEDEETPAKEDEDEEEPAKEGE